MADINYFLSIQIEMHMQHFVKICTSYKVHSSLTDEKLFSQLIFQVSIHFLIFGNLCSYTEALYNHAFLKH